MKRKGAAAIAVLVLSLLGGYWLAGQINSFLGISFHEKSLPQEEVPSLAGVATPLPPLDPIAAIVLPQGSSGSDIYRVGAAELGAAIALRTGQHPVVVEGGVADAARGRVIRVSGERETFENRESFAIRSQGQTISIRGGSDLANLYGMTHLAERLYAGIGEAELGALDQTVTPALPHRFVDLGGVGIVPDSAAWRLDDYSHHNRAFHDVIQASAPFVDPIALQRVQEQFRVYAQRMAAYGYNGIIFPGFLHYINFDRVGDGFEVYGPDSEYRRRHLALREAFGEMFRYAHGLGMSVVLATDMLALSDPLERYFQARFGRIDVSDPALWEVYRLGMAELFETFPSVDGVLIRIGEAGSIYNLEGWNYRSELYVRTDPAVRTMLRAFSDVAAAHDRTLFFRSWTVGVGEVGDLHTNPETYARVLGGLDLPNMVVSTKYVIGDFYSYLPFNPTLFMGEEPRMVELQARREFEAFGAFPNYLAPLHQQALQEVRTRNPHLDGVWLWTQEGGPPRAGPWSLYPFHGFWQLVDADVYVGARLAWDPDADITALTPAWVRRTFGGDPRTVANLTEMMFLSREAVLKGLYIGEFARWRVLALGLEPPPMMWIFEWDIVSGASSVLSSIYLTSRANIDAAIAEGFEALEVVHRMQALAGAVDRSTVAQPEVYDNLVASLAYQENLLETLAWYRQAALSYYRWVDTGDTAAYREWRAAWDRFESAREVHLARYDGHLDFPAFAFFDADAGLAHAERSPVMIWLSRLLLALVLFTLLAGSAAAQRRTPDYPGKRGVRALWMALLRPWRLGGVAPRNRADWLAVGAWPLAIVALAHLAFSSFLSPSYALLVFLGLGGFMGALLLLNRELPRFPLWAAITAPLLAGTGLLLVVLAVRGPLYYWYQFWTSATFRVLLISLGAAAFGWLLFVVFSALRRSYGRRAHAAVGQLLLAIGTPLLLIGALVWGVGLEQALTAINDELAVLPLGLSRILGITTHLDIPLELPIYMMLTGGVLVLAGGLLQRGRKGTPGRVRTWQVVRRERTGSYTPAR